MVLLSALTSVKPMYRPAVAPRAPGAVELGRSSPAWTRPSPASGRNHPTVLGDDAPPEIRGVELHAPDSLVHCAELGHRERAAHESRRDSGDLELDANALDGVADDLHVVERQLDETVEHGGHGDEGRVLGVGARDDRADVAQHCDV